MADMAEEEMEELNQKPLGCSHYKRNCALVSPCCGQVYICRLCHDEKENHEIDRHCVREITCLKCSKQQVVNQECVDCKTVFGTYFCDVCNMFDNKDKGQFHCEGCGICRIGGRDNFFHCQKCDTCLGVALEGNHKCVEKVSHANCSVCMEDLHSSRECGHIPSCGHLIHRSCYKGLLKSGNFACPQCGESMIDMSSAWEYLDKEIEDTPMPEDYKDYRICVLCKDCHKNTELLFHVIGHKCKHCGSYNTRKVSDVTQPPVYTSTTEDEES